MIVYPVICPGTWLQFGNDEFDRGVDLLLLNLETQFIDATLALNLFIDARAKASSLDTYSGSHEEWEANKERERRITEEILPGLLEENGIQDAMFLPYHMHDKIRIRVAFIKSQEDWANGVLPRRLEKRALSLHARSFLYALDTFYKTLKKLSKLVGPYGIDLSKQLADFDQAFPGLIDIRDSAHHTEDRILGVNKAGKSIFESQSPGNPLPEQGGTVVGRGLVLDNLFNTKYGFTSAKGIYKEIDISANSLETLSLLYSDVLNAFTGVFTGYPSIIPG